MPDITDKVKSNMRERINAVAPLITTPFETILTGVKKVISMQPVKGVTYVLEHAGDGTVNFVNTQADITRKWMS